MQHAWDLDVAAELRLAAGLLAPVLALFGASDPLTTAVGERFAGRSPGQRLRRVDDRLVAGAAADVAVESGDHVVAIAQLAGVSQRLERQQESRGAEAALERGAIDEGALEFGELGSFGEALDRQDLAAVRVAGQKRARADRLIVDEDRAGAADLDVAGSLCPGQAEPLSQGVEEQLLAGTTSSRRVPLTTSSPPARSPPTTPFLGRGRAAACLVSRPASTR